MNYPLPPIIGFHGCSRDVAEQVFAGQNLKASENDYDWLGSGIYFWVNSFDRALEWANFTQKKNPYVIGAFIQPQNCLNMTDYGVAEELKQTYEVFRSALEIAGQPVPNNSGVKHNVKLYRRLDCSVINFAHTIREKNGSTPYDSVYGFFEEGTDLFPNSALKEKSHVQIAVRNNDCIIGYFRPKELW